MQQLIVEFELTFSTATDKPISALLRQYFSPLHLFIAWMEFNHHVLKRNLIIASTISVDEGPLKTQDRTFLKRNRKIKQIGFQPLSSQPRTL